MVVYMEAELKKDRKYSTLKMVEKREIGRQFLRLDTLRSKYYKHMKMSLNSQENHGAIFNMQFSPNGKMLVVACEERAILMYDPNTRKCLHRLPSAHSDCVNCICFCDERIFASGSDDCTIALWDARMLKEQVMNLSGHTGWVKSLVYVVNSGLLLSSAYDGTVRTWDINRSSNLQDNTGVIFEANDVSRMQLTPDEDKIIISCLNYLHGDIVVIFHNLDLSNFADDVIDKWLKEIPQDYLGHEAARRNIPEVLDTNLEYPKHPLRIPSFQVHPDGSCLVSRYLAMNIEYTTVHDIQQYTVATGGKCFIELSGGIGFKNRLTSGYKRRLSHYILESGSAHGVIKEQSFSPDGHVIASPFAHGARILAFDPGCSQWRREDSKAKFLSEVKFLLGHQMPVCCSKFSPNHMLLATGCLGGKIVFHEPKL